MNLTLKNFNQYKNERHPFHLVDRSPWPLLASLSALQLVLSLTLCFYQYENCLTYLHFATFCLIFIVYQWFKDIIIESTFQGKHTKKVQKGLKMGMLLFIVSEIMFFFSFFWAFFHSSLAPTIWIGCVWPPLGIETINYLHLPLLNTIILLSSGVSLTWSHRAIVNNDRLSTIYGLIITILWGILFTLLQFYEYKHSTFSINDSVYGSVFFLLTGFHGFHVIMGTVLLIVSLFRQYYYHFLNNQHIGFESSIWYWHFVDVVWIFLYIFLYCWGA